MFITFIEILIVAVFATFSFALVCVSAAALAWRREMVNRQQAHDYWHNLTIEARADYLARERGDYEDV